MLNHCSHCVLPLQSASQLAMAGHQPLTQAHGPDHGAAVRSAPLRLLQMSRPLHDHGHGPFASARMASRRVPRARGSGAAPIAPDEWPVAGRRHLLRLGSGAHGLASRANVEVDHAALSVAVAARAVQAGQLLSAAAARLPHCLRVRHGRQRAAGARPSGSLARTEARGEWRACPRAARAARTF